MADKTQRLLNKIKKQANPQSKGQQFEPKNPIMTDMFLPNHSGEHDAGIKRRAPTQDMHLVNKKYVDDEITSSHNPLKVDHIAEKTAAHGVVVDNTIYADGRADGFGLDVLRSVNININLEVGQDLDVVRNIIVGGTVDGIDVGVDVAANTTHRQDNSQAHTDYMLNTGDTSTGDYNFTAGDLTTTGTYTGKDIVFIEPVNGKTVALTANKNSDGYLQITGTDIVGFNMKPTSFGSLVFKLENEDDHFQQLPDGQKHVYWYEDSTTGRNKQFRLYGFPTGGTLDYASFQITGTGNDLTITNNKAGAKTIFPKAIASGAVTITTSAEGDEVDVSEVNTIFIAPNGNPVIVAGFAGGVIGQKIDVVVTNATQNVTMEHNDPGNTASQHLFLHLSLNETLDSHFGGWQFVCDGSNWYDNSHARHV